MGQQVLSTSGGVHLSSNIVLSFTLGQPVSKMIEGVSLTLTQGFQQPSLIITSAEVGKGFQISVYPNPVTNELTIEDQALLGALSFSIVDVNGRTLVQGTTNSKDTRVDVSNLPGGVYTIIILDARKKKIIHKILKIFQ